MGWRNMQSEDAGRTAGIVLAAGASSRMGREKQLLSVRGGTLLGRVLDACLASGLDEVALVLGHEAHRILESLARFRDRPRLKIVVNPRYAEGMSTSLIAGLGAVEASCDRVMIVLGDMPQVTAEMIDRLRLEVAASGCSLGAVAVQGRRSHPVVIGREHFGAVHALEGDRGARDLFRDHPDDLCLVDAAEGWEASDIDTPEDYERFRRAEALPPCLILIDKEGRWFHEGKEMIHREFIRLFYENMELDGQGRYIIQWEGEQCVVDVEDTAFVVRRVDRDAHGVTLFLSDDTREPLGPDTIHAGKDHVLYCRVKQGRFPARFTRPAYYQLAEQIEEHEGGYAIRLDGTLHVLEGLS